MMSGGMIAVSFRRTPYLASELRKLSCLRFNTFRVTREAMECMMTATMKAIATMSIRKMISSAVSSISRGNPIQVRNSLMAFSRAWANRFVFITVCALNRCAGVLLPYWVFVRLRGMRSAVWLPAAGAGLPRADSSGVSSRCISRTPRKKYARIPFRQKNGLRMFGTCRRAVWQCPANPESRKSWKPSRVLSAYFHGCFYQNLNSYGKTE